MPKPMHLPATGDAMLHVKVRARTKKAVAAYATRENLPMGRALDVLISHLLQTNGRVRRPEKPEA